MSTTWRYYDQDLTQYERDLDALEYEGIAPNPLKRRRRAVGFYTIEEPYDGPLTARHTASLLTTLQPPHGYGLLEPLPLPRLPSFPTRPYGSVPESQPSGLFSAFSKPNPTPPGFSPAILEKEKRLRIKTSDKQQELERKRNSLKHELQLVKEKCEADDYDAVRFLINLSHRRHLLPSTLYSPMQIDFDKSSRVVLCTIAIPDFAKLAIVKQRANSYKTTPVTATEHKRQTESLIYSLCLRAAYLAGQCNIRNWFDVIAVNATQTWNDAATGQPKNGIIASLQAQTKEVMALHIDQVDPKACFRHFKGISTPSVENIAPVKPIFVLNKNDSRIVQERDIAGTLEPEANIAAMPWEDFEHLVRQLFEWEFGKNGIEVKVFRLSRDHGVDAVMYDPDPLRGGAYVLQAKRYTRPVDVAAVRDLYGTVVNEGANRGILVTTSSFGPDSYEFAKGKPISLIDGPNLIAMLRKHGQKYRIDLDEAKRLAKQAD